MLSAGLIGCERLGLLPQESSIKLERITSVRSNWLVETQSSAMFARPSLPSTHSFITRLLDRPGGEGLAARLSNS